jgi:hypothetical protein
VKTALDLAVGHDVYLEDFFVSLNIKNTQIQGTNFSKKNGTVVHDLEPRSMK